MLLRAARETLGLPLPLLRPAGKAKGGVNAKAKAKTPSVAKAASSTSLVPALPNPPESILLLGQQVLRHRKRRFLRPPAKRTPKIFIAAIGGGRVNYTEYPDRHTGKIYANWTFECPHHHGCSRVMGTSKKNTTPHGFLQPLAFLHVWRDVCPTERGHRLTPVKQEPVSKFFEEHEEELMAIWNVFATP